MVEVTQDRRAAQELFDKALGEMASFAEFGSPSYQEAALRTITEAIAAVRIAERERCAGICDEMEQDQNGRAYDKRQAGRDDTHNCAKAAAAGQLAQAIREQSNGA